jgi:DNA processing protein
MTRFGLTQIEIRSAVARVTAGEIDDQAAQLRFAHAAWNGIIEPGDRAAGALVNALGAVAALEGLLDGWTASHFASKTRDCGAEVEDINLVEGLERWRSRMSSTAAITALGSAASVRATMLLPTDPEWPVGLEDLRNAAPLALWVRGNVRHLRTLTDSIALIGARAATGYGETVCMEAAAGLVERGYSVTAGAAYGIDAVSHRSTMAAQGVTLAFLAGGVDRFYPAGHDSLLARVVETGAVISEIPCGTAPTKWRFIQRNRLIAAATRATVVVEAGWRSGALNTAGHAAALGRPLGAVPGPVTSPSSAGCHRLFREGLAKCVTNAEDIAELAPLSSSIEA